MYIFNQLSQIQYTQVGAISDSIRACSTWGLVIMMGNQSSFGSSSWKWFSVLIISEAESQSSYTARPPWRAELPLISPTPASRFVKQPDEAILSFIFLSPNSFLAVRVLINVFTARPLNTLGLFI